MGKRYGLIKMTDGRVEQVEFSGGHRCDSNRISQLLISLGYGKDDFNLSEVCMGVDEELSEHGDVIGTDEMKAVKIAIAHLKEMPDYYTKMKAFMGEKPRDEAKAHADERVG